MHTEMQHDAKAECIDLPKKSKTIEKVIIYIQIQK